MPALGPWELVIILLIVVVIFGAGRLAEIGGALGKSVREFRSATTDEEKAREEKAREEKAKAAAAHTAPVPSATATAPAPVTSATATATAPVENKCPSCATVNPVGQVFCGQCGTRLTRAAPAA
jgi:sec-independent protein translocase protein TatA